MREHPLTRVVIVSGRDGVVALSVGFVVCPEASVHGAVKHDEFSLTVAQSMAPVSVECRLYYRGFVVHHNPLSMVLHVSGEGRKLLIHVYIHTYIYACMAVQWNPCN